VLLVLTLFADRHQYVLSLQVVHIEFYRYCYSILYLCIKPHNVQSFFKVVCSLFTNVTYLYSQAKKMSTPRPPRRLFYKSQVYVVFIKM